MKLWPKSSLVRDHARRRALLKFLKAAYPRQGADGRIGLIVAQCWNAGYTAGLKRGRRARTSRAGQDDV